MLKLKQLTVLLCLVSCIHSGFSQWGFSNEVGLIVGPVQFRSDFGVRNDQGTNFGNSGYGIGLIHYINFAYRADCQCYSRYTYFNDHFKLRSEISFNKTKLNHFGKWVDRNNEEANKLRAHTGEANNFDIGMQLEYFPLSIRDFQGFDYRLAPFISLGAHYTTYRPKAATTYVNPNTGVADNNILNPDNFWSPWEPGSINPDSGNTWSLVTSVGVRYKLTALSDLMLDMRLQTYFSDWIDGLNHQLPSNKNNDYLLWLNVGYIYYLD
ncbi:glutamate dehydrogenase [Bizionia sediminis]|uniref:Glutamate dehydrogenase n=1 Tax=Bizionia sediminis TaxID=1737064 RepID=A0ABW5KRR8_9FLAO